MKKTVSILTALLVSLSAFAGGYDDWFEDATLRLDYIFSGDSSSQQIAFLQAYRTDIWAGRRTGMDKPFLEGNGQITVRDAASGQVIYANTFSTLFQEWQDTEEATRVTKGFENCFQVPWPKQPVTVTVTLRDNHRRVTSELTHPIDPSDILIRPLKPKNTWRQIAGGGYYDDMIDVAIIGDGYTKREQKKFYADASRAVAALMAHEPFKSESDKFSFVAVGAISDDAGVSVPHDGQWRNTTLSSHYDTFYTDRYLTTSSMRELYFELAGIPFEHIIVLVNTEKYGGGGIFNSVTLAAADHPTFEVVLVHEFGHAFAGLADEYYYDDQYSEMYPHGVEPWEPNITTLVDFGSKWKDMLPEGASIPTAPDPLESENDVRRIWSTLTPEQKAMLNSKIGVYEGAGYQSRGVYRPVQECRMKINECELFCPVCSRAIVRMIDHYTGK